MRIPDFDGLDLYDSQYERQYREERKKEIFEQYRAMMIRELLANESGQIFLGMMIISSGLLTNSHINSNTKQEPEPNAMQMSFNEGRRFIGEMLYSLLDGLNPDEEYPFKCIREYRRWLKNIDVVTNRTSNHDDDNDEDNHE